MVELSIIIPIHNSEKYLKKCIDSIYDDKDILINRFEVICIDDYSTDQSNFILQGYQRKFSNFTLITYEQNMQQGYARNAGVKKAKGKYIWFVDSDDYLEKNAIQKLLKETIYNFDIIQFNANKLDENFKFNNDIFLKNEILNISGIEYLELEMNLDYKNRIKAVWSKLYRRNFLIDFNIKFQEGVFYEDVLFTFKTFYYAEKIKYIPYIFYNYFLAPDSDLRGELSGKKILDTFRFCIDTVDFMEKNNLKYELILFQSRPFVKTMQKYKSYISTLSKAEFFNLKVLLHLLEINKKKVNTIFEHEDIYWLYDMRELDKLRLKNEN